MKGKMKKLICKNCKYEETLEDINLSYNTKILIAQVPRVREKDGLNIYPLHCLKCDYITEWASDPNNDSGKAVYGVEYFKTFKINKKLALELSKLFLEVIIGINFDKDALKILKRKKNLRLIDASNFTLSEILKFTSIYVL